MKRMDIPPFAKKSGDVQEDPRTGYCWWGTLTHTFNQWVSQILLLQKGHTWHTFNFFFFVRFSMISALLKR